MKKFAKSNIICTFAVTVPVLHPVRSAHGSSFFIGFAVLNNAFKTHCRG